MPVFLTVLLIIAGSLLVLALLYCLILVRPSGRLPKDLSLLTDYAHRGLYGNGVPENSLTAFRLACEKGYGSELDVQLSKDGVVMVFHDDTLTRMTGCEKKLCELTRAELDLLRLDGTDERIPTLEEVLATVDGKTPLLIELKGENLDTSLCPKLAELLCRYKGSYCLESFNPLLIKVMKKLLPGCYRGLLYTNVVRERKLSLLNVAATMMITNFLATPNFIAYDKRERRSIPVRLTTGLFRAPKFVFTVRGKRELLDAHERGESAIFENIDQE